MIRLGIDRVERTLEFLMSASIWTRPWLGWVFVYTVAIFFFIYRCAAMEGLVSMYATAKDGTLDVILGALSLGFLQDVVCTTYFALALWLFDAWKCVCSKYKVRNVRAVAILGNIATFSVSWVLFVAFVAPFAADSLIVRLRGMRFTFELIAVAIAEKDHISAAPISAEEINEGYLSAVGLGLLASVFAFVRTRVSWADLTRWNPVQELVNFVHAVILSSRLKARVNPCEDEMDDANSAASKDKQSAITPDFDISDQSTESLLASSHSLNQKEKRWRFQMQILVVIGVLMVMPSIVVVLSWASAPLIAYAALNTTLNELLLHSLEPTAETKKQAAWVDEIIHGATEIHTLFGPETLYRRTTGFQGDLAFDVKVERDNPPNVLLIVVESFRYQDSHYLVGDEDASNLFKGSNITVTPNFDKWAMRGVTLRNMWSSIPTSRSLESLLFGQIPYDSPVKTGVTGGRRDTKLAGLPQLFTAKGYETFFTTGCTTDYDNWDIFLPSHGFDTVWNNRDFVRIAESDLGISHSDWYGSEHRGFNWGVHDDVSFQLLGDLLVNKTIDQRDRVAKGGEKKPLFLNHYTISSHGPAFEPRPTWYANSNKPDFSALYEGEKRAGLIKNYLEMRYFADVELGKFMDRMSDAGVLNDTIVVIVGDHGQAPESDVTSLAEVSTTRVAGAIIAEGRLGDSVGLVIDDATEHYDILNTLADITGVPEGGFEQNGVGRSLKRSVKFGERVVYSNNPNRKMALVRGHQRLSYDRVSDAVLLHDADKDHDMTSDLFLKLSGQEKGEWLTQRDIGRQLNSYTTERWEKRCLLTSTC